MARARKASGAKDDKTGKAKKSQSRKKQAATRAAPTSKSSSGSKRAGSGNKSTKRGVKSGTSRSKKSPPKKPAKKKAVTKSTSKATSGASSSSGGSGGKKSTTTRSNANKKASSSTSRSSTTKNESKSAKSKVTKSSFPAKFLKEMRELLETERDTYERQAAQLRAEAESLVEDLDPGDVQFDEESGEGDTIAVERNRDLALASRAQEMIGEIDHALTKFDDGTYGICEISGEPIPKERLEAIPWAREKVEFKVGGFGRR